MSSSDPKWLLLAAAAFIGFGVLWSSKEKQNAPPAPAPIHVRVPYNDPLTLVFQENVEVQAGASKGTLKLESAGNLVLSTGRLVIADGCLSNDPFERDLPKGSYPVILSVVDFANDRRVAYARVEVAPGVPVSWKAAGSSEAIGIPVDGGTISFCDLEVAKVLQAGAFEATHQKLHTAMFPSENPVDWRLSASVVVDEKTGANVVVSATGWGDGGYPVYFGFDAKGQILAVVADFGVLTSSVSR